MPTETKIEYKNKGFWIPESFIEILSFFICQVFERSELTSFSSGLQEIYGDCVSNRSGAMIGMVNILFDTSLNTTIDVINFIDILEQTKPVIASYGDQLSIEKLNKIESGKIADSFKNPWQFPIKTQSLIATIDIIIQLLNGTWQSDKAGIYYKGFPKPDRAEDI